MSNRTTEQRSKAMSINYTGPVETAGEPVKFDRIATISRTKLYRRAGLFAWQWLYSVSLDGARPVQIGTSLSTARSWAKARGATDIREPA